MVKFFLDKGPVDPPAPAAPMPEGIQNIAKMMDTVMPAIENLTGLKRREIFLQLMKTGIKGGNVNTFLDSLLMGKPVEKEIRFVRIVKTFAIWVPIALFLLGIAIVSVFLYAKLIMQLMGI